ncbi:cytochrome c biogenesis CcdA family protein [Microbacterium halophytorum]|uniref:cytochrome c biogenesis CcdA family protein n=1 Tax=Microbacterium halophytorum TaxID=2067568 RepID=UPI000CFCCCF8|nr:cytochrome c biogenesis protein CcdA [Microbacterium halophytorum]
MDAGSLVFDGALWVAIPIALLGGLLSFLSPCVLPLIPGYLGFIAGAVAPRRDVSVLPSDGSTETQARGRLVGGVLLFIAGFTLVFVTIIVLGGMAGGMMQRFSLQYGDLVMRILGGVIIAMGLVFIGFFGFAQNIKRPQIKGNLGLIGAPLLGVALGLGWAPCIGPTLTAITSIAYLQGDALRAAILGLAYSLGLGIPFLLVALGFGWATRAIGFLRRHVRAVNIIGGIMLVALGLLMATGVWTAWMLHLQGVFASVPALL